MFKSLKSRVLLLIVGIVAVTSATFMLLANKEVVKAMRGAEEESAKNSLRLVMMHVEREYNDLHSSKDNSLNAHKRELENIISIQESLIRERYNQAQKGLIDEDKVKKKILEETRAIRFGNNDYIWISDYSSRLISHPDPMLHGKDFSQVKDVNNSLIVPPMVEIARKSGKGFYSYWWRRLGTVDPVEKLAYVRLFPEWNWAIGTGVYIDDIETEANRRYKLMVDNLRETLSKIKIAKTGYVFIFNGSKQMIIHPFLEGKDISGLKNPATGKRLVEDLIAASGDPDKPFTYLWDMPADKENYIYPKESYVAYFKPLDWYVSSSVYKDEIYAPARNLGNKILVISIVFLFMVIVISIVFADTVTFPIRKLIEAMKGARKGEIPSITVKSSGTVETKELGDIFNSMISSIHETTNEKEQYSKRLEKSYEELEVRVEERTRELSISNTQMSAYLFRLKNEVAERQKAEEDLRKAKLEAEEANKMKSSFLANMSHEIRTPLNGIIGFSESILSSLSINDARSHGETILQESHTLLALINEILDHAKIESGKLVLEHMPFEVHLFLDRVKSASFHGAKKKGLEYNFHVEDNIPKYLTGDPLRLKQVLVNIINNAVKFTEKGSVTVRATAEDITSKHATLTFSVIDTGIGIPEEKQASIFDSFTQADASTMRKYGGTGLGTTISKQLVELMGGKIGLDSAPGKGSTFWFSVPLEISETPPACEDELLLCPGGTGTDTEDNQTGIKGNILIADDYRTNCEVIRLHLKDSGHTLQIAENGREAVAAFEKGDFDLILMDVQMPVLDGIDATRQIRSSEKEPSSAIVIIGVTANVDYNTKKACLEAGMDDVITKPIRRLHLLKTIDKWLTKNDTGTEQPPEGATTENGPGKSAGVSPIEYDQAMEEFGGEETILREVMTDFARTVSLQIQQIKAALDQKDMATIKKEAHKIKGGASNIVAMPLSNAAAQLEDKSGNENEMVIGELLNQLEREYKYFADYVSGMNTA